MKIYLAALGALFAAAAPRAARTCLDPVEYRRLELHELVGGAERIVEGVIEDVREKTYRLRVERVVHGTSPPVIDVRRFGNWTCAGRWGEYREGQRVLLFLRGDAAVGAGNEGDMPVLEGGALVPYVVRGSRNVSRWSGQPWSASWVELDDLERTVRSFREAFHFVRSEDRLSCRIEVLASDSELAELRGSSSFARSVLEGIERVTNEPLGQEAPAAGGLILRCEEFESCRHYDSGDGFYWPCTVGARVAVVQSTSRGVGLLVSGAGMAFLTVVDWRTGRLDRIKMERPRKRRSFVRSHFGAVAAGAGDLDGDGRVEILIGEPGGTVGLHKTGSHEGRVWLMDSVSLTPLETPPELVNGCGFGRSLARIGDLDGDGDPEFAFGRVRDANWPWGEERVDPLESTIAIVSLTSEGIEQRSTISAALFGASGPARGLTFASTLSGVGDVNGDGIPDLAIGDPHAHTDGAYAGSLWLAFLRSDGSVDAVRRIDLGDCQPPAGGEFGASLASIGDVDGNGTPDLLVAGAEDLYVVLLAPSGSVVRTHPYAAAALLPDCYQVRDVAAATGVTGEHATEVFVAGLFGSRRPHDSRVYALAVRPDGTLAGY